MPRLNRPKGNLSAIRREMLAEVRIAMQGALSRLTPPIDVVTMAHQFGVKEVSFEPLSIDAMLLGQGGHSKIVVNSERPRRRQRFSCAHELAHLLVDKVVDTAPVHWKPHYRTGTNENPDLERLCDQIAAEILMPASLVLPFVKPGNSRMVAIPSAATTFDVSIEAAALRVAELDQDESLFCCWRKSKETGGNRRSWARLSSSALLSVKQALLSPHPITGSVFSVDAAFLQEKIIRAQEKLAIKGHKGLVTVPTEAKSFGFRPNTIVISISDLSEALATVSLAF